MENQMKTKKLHSEFKATVVLEAFRGKSSQEELAQEIETLKQQRIVNS